MKKENVEIIPVEIVSDNKTVKNHQEETYLSKTNDHINITEKEEMLTSDLKTNKIISDYKSYVDISKNVSINPDNNLNDEYLKTKIKTKENNYIKQS